MHFGVAFSAEPVEIDRIVGAAVFDFDDVMNFEGYRWLELLELVAVTEAVPAEVTPSEWDLVDEVAVGLAARLAIVRWLGDPAEAMFRAADATVVLSVWSGRESAGPIADRARNGAHRSGLLRLRLHGVSDEHASEGRTGHDGTGLSIEPGDLVRGKIERDGAPFGPLADGGR